jgi:F-type H+-transporting ATPase subunit f
MRASLVRRQLTGLIPPKIATPSHLVKRPPLCPFPFSSDVSEKKSGGGGESLTPLVNFYSKLPKGRAPRAVGGGLKARYFSGANASPAPLVFTMLAILGLGYTIDYQSEFGFFFLIFFL